MTHAILTGPIKGSVVLGDGTEVDVKPTIVYVDTPEQAAEVADLIGQRYAAEGHPEHDHEDGFVYETPKDDK
jgi:hypothetical protein